MILRLSLAAQPRSAECHRGNKQQQLSKAGLIKHSALALQPADCCSLDQSRPDRPHQKAHRCHDHRLTPQVNARERQGYGTSTDTSSSLL
ncbi:hypothetical protein PBY51_021528 [Eleginops maclovinus]|uniref:Uncharacterized protein n=1 Tax=Eleginops maclovinus TaxID=56733 RepID=A0AAN7XG66_ELEMC|nr:hypothetical protein PBY51_021528 [Eleginops maclovinus]